MSIHEVEVTGSVGALIRQHHIELANKDQALADSEIAAFDRTHVGAEPRQAVLEIFSLEGNFASAEAVREYIATDGYEFADFADLVAFATQHPEYYKSRDYAFIDVLIPTESGHYPVVWYTQGVGCSEYLQVAFQTEQQLYDGAGGKFSILMRKLP